MCPVNPLFSFECSSLWYLGYVGITFSLNSKSNCSEAQSLGMAAQTEGAPCQTPSYTPPHGGHGAHSDGCSPTPSLKRCSPRRTGTSCLHTPRYETEGHKILASVGLDGSRFEFPALPLISLVETQFL